MPIHRSIPAKDVPMVKGMLLRNDPQQDIAWYVGVNNSRVNELKKQSTPQARQYADVPPAPPEELPPPGPHPSAREFYELLTVEKMLTEAAIGLAVWQMDIRQSQAETVIADLRWELERAKAANTDLRREAEGNKAIAAEAITNMNAIEAEKDQAEKNASQGWGAWRSADDKARAAIAEAAKLREEMAKAAKDTGPALHAVIDGLHACRLDGLNAAIDGLHDAIDATLAPFIEFADQPKQKRPKVWTTFIARLKAGATGPNGKAK